MHLYDITKGHFQCVLANTLTRWNFLILGAIQSLVRGTDYDWTTMGKLILHNMRPSKLVVINS